MTTLQSVHIAALPGDIEGFVTLRNEVATTPQGGAALMIVALLLCAEDTDLGPRCLAVAVDRRRLVEGAGGHEGLRLSQHDLQLILLQLARQPYLPRSYFYGATPENGYTLPAPPYRLDFSDNPYSGDPTAGPYKLFVACSAARARPVTLTRDATDGFWKAYEWSSLVVGIRSP